VHDSDAASELFSRQHFIQVTDSAEQPYLPQNSLRSVTQVAAAASSSCRMGISVAWATRMAVRFQNVPATDQSMRIMGSQPLSVRNRAALLIKLRLAVAGAAAITAHPPTQLDSPNQRTVVADWLGVVSN